MTQFCCADALHCLRFPDNFSAQLCSRISIRSKVSMQVLNNTKLDDQDVYIKNKTRQPARGGPLIAIG